MKNSIWKKAGASMLAVLLILTGSMLSTSSSAASAAQKNEETLNEKISGIVSINEDARAADKEETVYVIAGADGTAGRTIVTEWLKNPDNAGALSDYTELNNIENTNGYETYTFDGNTLAWDAGGRDIHYRGTTDKELPVTVHVTYFLDGVETAPEDMAGRSGHVTIRFDYTNNTKTIATVNGAQEDIYVPFLMANGLILDGDLFSNVTVSTGTVYNDGTRNIVIGCALPGLSDSLGLEDGDYNIPEYVEVEADTTDFSLSMTLTVALNGLFDSLNIDTDSGLTDLSGDLTALQDAARQIADGADDLADGTGALSDGLGSISSNSAALKNGAYAVFQSLTNTAAEQLNAALTAAGYDTVALTPSDYSAVLTGLLDTLSSGAYSQAAAGAEEQVRAAVTEQVTERVKAQVTEAVSAQVTEQVTAQLIQSLMEKTYTQEQAEAYLQTEEGQALVSTTVRQQMATDAVQQTISANIEQQMESDEVQQTIESNVAQQMASEAVRGQIDDAVTTGLAGSEAYQSIAGLKTQLDNYAAFYSGLTSYTGAVDSAYSGSKELAAGAGDLADGAREFYDEGIEKLVDGLSGDYDGLLDRLQAVADAGKAYRSFGGIAGDMSGSVKFIWRTEAI